MRRVKLLAVFGMIVVASATVAVGVYLEQYYTVLAFVGWATAELIFRFAFYHRKRADQNLPGLLAILEFAREVTGDTLAHLLASTSKIQLPKHSRDEARLWMERFQAVMELRALAFGSFSGTRSHFRQAFVFSPSTLRFAMPFGEIQGVQDIVEAATRLSELYWKLLDTCLGDYGQLSLHAKHLYRELFGSEFEATNAKRLIEQLTDAMQRHYGVPYLLLNLIHRGNFSEAQTLARRLVQIESHLDAEVRTALYWMAELYDFGESAKDLIPDYETSIRYLYHLCLTNPERVGFLEIDSRFYSQFDTINLLAQEGFLFKDTLLESILALWREYEGLLDHPFQHSMERLFGVRNKILDRRDHWMSYWVRERHRLSSEYLLVVEGNLSYFAGKYEDALHFYERALQLSPDLRSALLNSLFCLAQIKDDEGHRTRIDEILSKPKLAPYAIAVIANSLVMAGKDDEAMRYFNLLTSDPAASDRVDSSRSKFYFEMGMYDEALSFALAALKKNPSDSGALYHLSQCYVALGKKDLALDALKKVSDVPGWLEYYRFTLERDLSRDDDAMETLFRIPSEYFEDQEELESALEFARSQRDLTLVRHLRGDR